MSREHWALLAGFVGAIGVQLLTLEHGWEEAMTPGFIGSALVQIGVMLRAIYTERPEPKDEGLKWTR